MIGGVCAAFGQATPVPAWMWRAGFCVALVAWGAGIVVYIILMICIPTEREKGT
jgi:phage shock protein PspC (stress-responsive transcriptional regulator)